MRKNRRKRLFIFFPIAIFALLTLIKVAPYANDLPFQQLTFTVQHDSEEQKIHCWFDTFENQYYIFLPAHYNGSVTVHFNDHLTLSLLGHSVKSGSVLSDIPLFEPVLASFYNKSEKAVEEAALVFMPSSNIPSMFINTSSGKIDKINADKSYREEGSMLLLSSDGNIEYNGKLTYIHARGNSTFSFPKKPYTIKLAEESDLLNMGKAFKWILLANFRDNTHIKNKIIYDMANEVGLEYSPDSEFVNLYLNGEYVGLYQLTEKVEIGENRVNINDLEAETESLNILPLDKFAPFEMTDEFGSQKGFQIENNPPDITGGYIFMLENIMSRYNQNQSGVITSRNQPIVIESPRYASAEQTAYAIKYLQEIEDAIYAKNGINPNTGISYLEYIDLDSWVKKYLIEEIAKNIDSSITSQYFYKNNDDHKLYAGPVWDYDLIFGGHTAVINTDGLYANKSNKRGFTTSYPNWFSAIYLQTEFYTAVVREYEEVFLPLIQHLLNYKIDNYIYIIYNSFTSDNIRWKEAQDKRYMNFETIEENVVYLKNYIKERTEFLSSVWVDGESYYTVTGYNGADLHNSFFAIRPGEKLTNIPIYERAGYIFKGWYYVSDDTPFDENRPITEDIEIYRKWERAELIEVDTNAKKTIFTIIKKHYRYIPIAGFFFLCLSFFTFFIYRNKLYRIWEGDMRS